MNTIEEREQLKALLNNAKELSKGGELVVIDDTQMNLPAPKYDAKTYTLRCIKLNRDDEDILNSLKFNYLISEDECKKILSSCKNYLKKQYKEYAENVAEKNMLMLQQIAEDAIQDGQKKTAIEAIKEINRMTGLGTGNTYVQNNTQINFDNVEITFK